MFFLPLLQSLHTVKHNKNPGDKKAENQFKEAAEAYEVLSNKEKRAKYDQFGHAGFNNQGFGGAGMSMEDIFSQFGDIFGGDTPFESFFGGRSSGRQKVYKGSNLRIKIEISLGITLATDTSV